MLGKIIAAFAKLLPLQKAIACVAAAAVVGTAGTAAVITVNNHLGGNNNRENSGSVASGSDEDQPYEAFEAFALDSIMIIQRTASTYDIVVDADNSDSEQSAELYISRFDTIDSNASAQAYVLSGNTYRIDSVQLEAGEYFLHVVSGGQNASMHFDIPGMQPKIWMNGDIPNIEFEIDGSISWGTFIDNEGKNVYRSSSPEFDGNAVLLSGNMNILESSYTDSNPSGEQPYYYLMFTGKNGIYTYITSPLFYKAEQSGLEAEFTLVGDEPYLMLSGNIQATSREGDRVISLRVGNFDWDNPASTFMVENSAEAGDSTRFRFEIPLRLLKEDTNNLSLFLTENGMTLEWNIQAQSLNLAALRFEDGGSVYGLTNPDALQITRTVQAFERISATLYSNPDGGSPVMRIDGVVSAGIGEGGGDYELAVKSDGGESYAVTNAAEGQNVSFAFDLTQLVNQDVWYDVDLYVKSEDRHYTIMYPDAVGEIDSLQSANYLYSFREWENILKISYELNREFVNVSSRLELVNDKPLLLVSGQSTSPLAINDFFLALRNGDTLLTAENLASSNGSFSFEFDLARLSERNVWYDVLVGVRPDGDKLYDLRKESAADFEKAISFDDIEYGMREWEGDLKIEAQLTDGIYKNISARLEKQNDEPVLIVTGNVRHLDGKKVYLGVREEENIIRADNGATASDALFFRFDLRRLGKTDTWYDLVLLNDENDMTLDLHKDSAVEFYEEIPHQMFTYAFAEYEDYLKVYRKGNNEFAGDVLASIVMDDGTPTLAIEGTTDYAKYRNVYLAIRSGTTVYEARNEAGEDNLVDIRFDLTKLTRAGSWCDVMLGDKSTGVLVSLTTDNADMDSLINDSGTKYYFQEYEDDLKVTFSYDFAETVSAKLIMEDNKPIMKLEGALNGARSSNAFLRVKSGSKELTVKNAVAGSDEYLFKFDLTSLSKKDTWYDIEIGDKSSDTFASIPNATVDMSQLLLHDARQYEFAEWDGNLKVFFTPMPIKITSAEMVDNNGAKFVVKGMLEKIASSDIYLRVHNSEDNDNADIRVSNSAANSNEFRFEVDLSNLAGRKFGKWFDLKIGVASLDLEVDIDEKYVDATNRQIRLQSVNRTYYFEAWNSDLKIAFLPYTISEIELSKPSYYTISVKGAYDQTAVTANNMRLKIGPWDSKDTYDNVSGGTFMLGNPELGSSVFNTEGWNDLKIIINGDKEFDIPYSLLADKTQAISYKGGSGEGYYLCFKEYNGALKLACARFDVTSVTLEDRSGPKMIVEGTVGDQIEKDEIYLMVYNDQNGRECFTRYNVATSNGKLRFEFDLTDLPQKNETNWFDLRIGGGSDSNKDAWAEIADSSAQIADMQQTLIINGRLYSFEKDQWSNLKVLFNEKNYIIKSASLIDRDESGHPTLILEGEMDLNLGQDDVSMTLTNNADVKTVYNSSSAAGHFLLEYDTSKIDGQYSGHWYWFKIIVDDQKYDIPYSVWPGAIQTTGRWNQFQDDSAPEAGNSAFAFYDNIGQKKFNAQSVTLEEIGGVPTLVVTGKLDKISRKDAYLTIFSEHTNYYKKCENLSQSSDSFRFQYDLRQLSDTAEHKVQLLIGSINDEWHLNVDWGIGVDINQTLEVNTIMYSFEESSGWLYVKCDNLPSAVMREAPYTLDIFAEPAPEIEAATAGTTQTGDETTPPEDETANNETENKAETGNWLTHEDALKPKDKDSDGEDGEEGEGEDEDSGGNGGEPQDDADSGGKPLSGNEEA